MSKGRSGILGVLRSVGEASGMMTFDRESSQKAAIPPVPVSPAPPAIPSGLAATVPGADASADSTLTIPFPELYARSGVVGSPQTDPLLTAFAQMAPSLKGDPLVTAMGAMMQGMNTDPAAIVSTLDQRLAVLGQTLTDERAQAESRKTNRDQDLATFKEKALADIAELERQIAELKQQLADKDRETTQANASDLGTIKAFEQNVAAEEARLTALKTFLEGGIKV